MEHTTQQKDWWIGRERRALRLGLSQIGGGLGWRLDETKIKKTYNDAGVTEGWTYGVRGWAKEMIRI